MLTTMLRCREEDTVRSLSLKSSGGGARLGGRRRPLLCCILSYSRLHSRRHDPYIPVGAAKQAAAQGLYSLSTLMAAPPPPPSSAAATTAARTNERCSRLGSFELSVPLGIGTMFWGDSYVDSLFGAILPAQDLKDVVHLALSAGVTLFDTAEGYGGGTSEVRLGEAIRSASEGAEKKKAVVMTKVRRHWYRQHHSYHDHASHRLLPLSPFAWPPPSLTNPCMSDSPPLSAAAVKFLPTTWRWTERSFLRALHGCQRRLLVTTTTTTTTMPSPPIDIFYIHTPVHPRFEFWVACACRARQLGLIKEIGLSNCGARQVEVAIEIAKKHGQRIAANQVLFSLLSYNSDSLQRMERVCQQNGITIVAYSVLGQGLLTDHLTKEKFAGNRAAKMTGVKYEQLQGLRAEIRALASKYKVTMAQVCLNWATHKGTVPLVGIKNTKQLSDVLGSLSFQLSSEEVSRLDSVALAKATLEKSALRRGLFVVLLSVLILTYRATMWVPRWMYHRHRQAKRVFIDGEKNK